MTLTLLIFAVILIICILLSKITHKLGVPSLLLFYSSWNVNGIRWGF